MYQVRVGGPLSPPHAVSTPALSAPTARSVKGAREGWRMRPAPWLRWLALVPGPIGSPSARQQEAHPLVARDRHHDLGSRFSHAAHLRGGGRSAPEGYLVRREAPGGGTGS